MSILERDTEIHFPHFIVLKASAGSGKTHTLTERLVQFLLSDKIPHNRLRNILAITFSNNASKEMKKRALEWLKSLYFERQETVGEVAGIVSLEKRSLLDKTEKVIDAILITLRISRSGRLTASWPRFSGHRRSNSDTDPISKS